MEMAKLWRDAVNKYGGDVTVVHLPEIGIKGNTHFPFSDLNNVEIADLMSDWLKEKGLDNQKYNRFHNRNGNYYNGHISETIKKRAVTIPISNAGFGV